MAARTSASKSSPKKPKVVIGILGNQLDRGGKERWKRWRPTVDLARHDDFVISRFELLYSKNDEKLAHQVRRDFEDLSPESTLNLHPIDWKDPWDFEEVYAVLHDFAGNYSFDLEKENYLAHITTGTHVFQICMYLLCESRHIPGLLLQTSPPKGKRDQPGTLTTIDLDLSRYDRLASRFLEERAQGTEFLKSGIHTKNRTFNALIDEIERVALRSAEPMLLTGPTGAGKSQLAKKIYELRKSRRLVEGNFVATNCATLRGNAAMSALFGHVKGAYTGATSDRQGLMRAADKGILFLDEIAELGLDEQAMLLRAVEEGVFHPVGSDKLAKSEFQLLAGTNCDLAERVAQGRFRADLLARINLWTFALPGLAARTEDMEPNLEYELAQWTKKTGDRITFNKEARARFLGFAKSPEALWTGNFRDWSASIMRMATLAPAGRIDVATVDDELKRLRALWHAADHRQGEDKAGESQAMEILGKKAWSALDRFDQVQLVGVLAVCRESKTLSEAGRRLFAESRKRKAKPNDADRLRKYLARFDLRWDRVCG